MSLSRYNQIIKKVCSEILLPVGVFQKGSSGVYIDDNGYFFTVIEFQPSRGSGIYLNVGLHFLWNEREYLSFDFPLQPRVKNLLVYENDEQFAREVTEYTMEALELVKCYRQMRDVKTAKRLARKYRDTVLEDHLKILNQRDDDSVLQRIRQTRAFWRSKPAVKKLPQDKAYDFPQEEKL